MTYKALFVAMVFFVASFFDAHGGACKQEAGIATKNVIAEHFGRASWYGPGFVGRHQSFGQLFQIAVGIAEHRRGDGAAVGLGRHRDAAHDFAVR